MHLVQPGFAEWLVVMSGALTYCWCQGGNQTVAT